MLVPSRVIELTQSFYEWEIRGRGWIAYPHPVPLEPPFLPFRRESLRQAPLDDARRSTFLSSLVERFLPSGSGSAEAEQSPEEEEVLPERVIPSEERAEYQLILPPGARVSPEVIHRWLQTLAPCGALSFELSGNGDGVSVSLSGDPSDAELALGHLRSLLPEVDAVEAEPLSARWDDTSGPFYSIIEFGLAREFMLPLGGAPRAFSPDPLTPLIGALGALPSDEFGIIQVLFERVRAPWVDSMLQAVTTATGDAFFADAPEITKYARDKASSPLFAIVFRLGAKAESEEAVWQVVRRLAGGLTQLGSPETNELVPLPSNPEELLADLLSRSTHRSGMLLSAPELLSLVHPPSESVQVPALIRAVSRSKEAPAFLQGDGLVLGENLHRGEAVEVALPEEARLRHMHVVGASGTGKSTLLVNLILQDIEAGRGVGVLDPHGDLIDDVLARLPEERMTDVVLFDPGDAEYRVGWNILGARSEVERELLASDLVAVFRRLSTSWGDQMTSVLSNAVLSFLDSSRGGTLLDLRRFLIDERFRKDFLSTVRDEHLRSYWTTEFPLLVGRKPQGPILTRLDTFLRSRRIRDIVTVRQGLDFRRIVDSGRIFLAKLSQGAIGEENAALLGSLLVSKFHQVVMSRADVEREARRPFFLYLDEFHEVATPSMGTLFSGVRKYGLGLIVAHQDLYQLHTKARDVERSVLANAHTRICFRLGDEDARTLEKGFGYFEASDLMGLKIGEAICRVGSRDADFNLRTARLGEVDAEEARARREAIRRVSGERWGERRDEEERLRTQPEAPEEPISVEPDAEVREKASEPRGPKAEAVKAKPAASTPQLDKEVLDYLEHVAREPFLGVRERNDALGLSAWKGGKTKEELLSRDLVREVVINPGGRGERFKLLELTSSGRGLLSSFSVSPALGHGRGGVAHQWWVRTIASWCEGEGYEVSIEDESRGARVDLLVSASGEAIAVEVETSEGHVLENLRKDQEAGFERILSLIEDPGVFKRFQRKLPQDPKGVALGLLPNFEEHLTSLLTPAPLAPPNQDQEPRAGRRPSRRRKPKAPARPVRTVELAEPGAYTTPLAADYLGLSPATLETQRVRGGGPVFVKLGRRVVYRREDLDSWLEERRRKSTSDPGESL